ncbi:MULTISPECIES: porin [Paraburkholderia]|nr:MULTISPECIES: porin [Paraburkholderia]RKR31358.1 outer membrane protein OmpU [Paraburkholderia sp. BL17N1]
MRRPLSALAIMAMALSTSIASAQSSITLYGTLATGLIYSPNVRGGAYAAELDNDHWNSTVGLKGKEDLGAALSTVFNLQMAIRPSSGTLAGAGGCTQLFCKAYVGLADEQLGTLTVGRQNDYMAELLPYQANYYSTTMAAHPGGIDRFNFPGVNNALKYRSVFGPLTVGFMYALPDSTATGQAISGRTLSALLAYSKNGIDAAIAWSSFSDYALKPWSPTSGLGFSAGTFWGVKGTPGSTVVVPLARLDMAGAGAGYTYGPARVAIGAFDVHLRGRNGESASMPIVNANVGYYVKPDFVLGCGYWHANFAATQTRYDNVNVSADYFLSKRTDVFISPVYEHTSGRGLAQLFMLGSASGGNQFAVDVGIRHNF